MRKEHKTIEAIILILVLLTAATGLYYMYTVSTGKAFLQAPTFVVKQTTFEYCCCAPVSNEKHLFRVFGQITKDADLAVKTAGCTKICNEHGSTAHPVKLLHVGKCGSV
jgi:hypothetical protein